MPDGYRPCGTPRPRRSRATGPTSPRPTAGSGTPSGGPAAPPPLSADPSSERSTPSTTTAEPLTTAPLQPPDRLASRKEAALQSTCPNCDKHDNIYVRSGGALVCRECA